MNQRALGWISRHPVQAFFLLGITICFGTMFPAVLIIPQDTELGQILILYLRRNGAYSPVLAGMFVARIIEPARKQISLARRLSILLTMWFIALIIHTASLWLAVPSGTSLILLIVLSLPVAFLPAFVISSPYSGADGVKDMLATLVRPNGSIVYYLVALLTFPVIQIVGSGITNILNGNTWLPQVSQGADFAIAVFITFFSVLLFSEGKYSSSGDFSCLHELYESVNGDLSDYYRKERPAG